ncbi:MAG TPA: hypothetical protein VIY51_25445 [Xanthobacteraceae bacterium]
MSDLSASAESGAAIGPNAEAKTYPVLSGAFLIALAAVLVLVTWAAGTENYPYIHQRVVYRFPLATLDRVYLVALAVLALHYAAYVAHYLTVGARQQAGPTPPLAFSPIKFVITWFLLIGLAGAYAVGASIATPALFDTAFGPARDTAFVRVWNHTYFGFVLLASLLAGVIYLSVTNARRRGIVGMLHWLRELLSLRSGHRFLGALNWILLLALISNFATGFFILGSAPLLAFPRLPLHAYAQENWARLAHDVGTAFIVASFSGQIYLRLIPGNQWMLKTMFAGYEAEA